MVEEDRWCPDILQQIAAVTAALDKVGLPDVLGTIVGDDTLLVVSRDPDGGPALADRLRALAERTPAIYPELKTDLEEELS